MISSHQGPMKDLFVSHLKSRVAKLQNLLEKNNKAGIILDSGTAAIYFSDDQSVSFRSNPYFRYFCPLDGEKHLLCINNKGETELFIYEPQSFWSDLTYDLNGVYWVNAYNKIEHIRSEEERQKVLESKKSWTLVSSCPEKFKEFSDPNPDRFLKAFDWWRCQKTKYEIFCLEQANKKAAEAHKKVRELFYHGNPSEIELHYEYLRVLGDTQDKLPYSDIIAYDEKAAILHYQYKRKSSKGKVLLIDSGATFAGYCSDITRTYTLPSERTAVFSKLITSVNQLQQEICHEVKTNVNFIDLQILMHQKLAKVLLDLNILNTMTPEAAFEKGLTKIFCPHGLGHMLGIMTHDVGGFQINEEGQQCEKDPRMPHARMNRNLRENEIITIEPGLYFIPFLLDEKKNSKESSYFNWELIETLIPLGGVRIEDNIVVQNGGHLNLTRPFLP